MSAPFTKVLSVFVGFVSGSTGVFSLQATKKIVNEKNILFYNDEEGNTKIEVLLENEDVWLNTEALATSTTGLLTFILFISINQCNLLSFRHWSEIF